MADHQNGFVAAWHRSSTDITTWWFAPVGGFTAALIMWGLGVPMTFSEWLPHEPILRAAFDVVVCVIAAYVLIFAFWLVWFWSWRLRTKVNWYLFATIILTLGAIVALSSYFWDRARGPILWDWKVTKWIGYSYGGDSPVITFNSFQIVGTNRWDDPFIVTEAYVRSDITTSKVDLVLSVRNDRAGIRYWIDNHNNVIPAGRGFMLSGSIPSNEKDKTGLSDTALRKDFARFTIILNSQVVRRFYESDVENYIAKILEERRISGN